MNALRSSCALLVSTLVACASALHPIQGDVAARAEDANPQRLYADIRQHLREIEHEPDAGRREQLAVEAVKLGQRCDQAAPGHPLCDYGLSLALGVQAREKPATARDGLGLMVKRLGRAAANDPRLDHAGPERVLGLLLTRAPGWPSGPGDPASGLASARKAAQLEPNYAPNWLAVAEAADKLGDARARREAARTASALATEAQKAGDRDALKWQSEAEKMLKR